MNFDWYFIENKADFVASGFPSKELTLQLEDRGLKEILLTQGNLLGITVDDVFVAFKLNDWNPNTRDGIAAYEDEDGGLWLGYLLEDED